jgi:CRP/FNR family cyclic AMP-dependent transcriptional regulator
MEWPLLAGVPAEEVQQLLAISRRRRFAKGEVVFHRGDPGDSLHLVVSGRFAIRLTTPLGDTATLGIRGPGESFGELALVDPDAHRSATVEALEPAETRAVAYSEFERLQSQRPEMGRVLVALLGAALRRTNELLLDALYVPAERRVLRRLAELAAGGEVILTQEELAQVAGTSRSTVNRVLREEEKRGAIALERGRTVVLDLAAIQRRGRVTSE